ncbi:DeoR/GlpR family DNA-binding transcription regulator [Brucella anthropi]|uniref:DeoR/GlpR family DNA-binding transcription regulator n=1 Tax=Brucella anthropi TaxID=529 RepID=UPI0005BE2093|nr:DeoR faimly transcriptional regulator [Brucella anthropi]
MLMEATVTEFLLHERQARIQELLQQSGRVLAADLAESFGVSEDTIRRDLREMAAAGLCKRVYGGALKAAPSYAPLAERDRERPEAKTALAATLAALIEPNMTVFLDSSSTNLALARFLADRGDVITVVTNTPSIAAIVLQSNKIDVVMIGGPIDRRVSAAVGTRALRDAELVRPDLCMLGVCGFSAETGITALHLEDAEFKRVIAGRSRKVVLAITSDKLGTVAAHDVLPIEAVNVMAVEYDVDEAALAPYAALGMKILRAAADRN